MKIYEVGYIYKIVNDVDDKIYIGSTTSSLSARMYRHRSDAKNCKMNKLKLYNHMREIGIEHFKIELVEEIKNCVRNQLRILEDKYIKLLDTVKNGLNGRYLFKKIILYIFFFEISTIDN